ncbi:MAG: RagB/SusD family nutrient uptake outer membrane protein [Alloprevotella sp.]|nr:RagB/SusD family nutrient uptake outer membrane protein [Alloprevotella sp.]
MKRIKISNKIIAAGLCLAGFCATSCEDFLTVSPADRITEEDFWKSKSDLDNVRAAAYRQMASSAVTSRIIYWGELRSDNVTLNDQSQQSIQNLQQGILMPTEGMFSWSAFYTGINYCNLVLEKGEEMTIPGQEVDPSFRRSDWQTIKAEMLSLRALYYFYLVRAYRNVPYVDYAVRTDVEAQNCKQGQTLGVEILGKLTDQLESNLAYAADNFGSASENTGRFTKRGVHALLADMYLWRGAMLTNSAKKGDYVLSAAGDTLNSSQVDNLRDDCYRKAIQHADYILNYMQQEYDKDLAENPGMIDDNANNPYPYLTRMGNTRIANASDYVYSQVWEVSNSSEAVFQLKYDANASVSNDVPYTYFANYSGNSVSTGYMSGSNLLSASAPSAYDPEVGYGKTDIRLLETLNYSPTTISLPTIHKNVLSSLSISNMEDMTEGASSKNYRSVRSQNWPIYRLTDIMLIKAEAIARLNLPSDAKASTNAQVAEGFKLTNAIFERNNPRLQASGTSGAGELVSDRLKEDYATNADAPKTASELLSLVYNERQREFVAEGKRWFDIVRQCEATNSTVSDVLSSFISLSTSVRNRLKLLMAMYNPIYSEEIKINGVEYGGNLVQNPVWDRYTSNK